MKRKANSLSVKAVKFPKTSVFSAFNLTQNGVFQINAKFQFNLDIGADGVYAFKIIDVRNEIATSTMHVALSCCFDQWRIEKVRCRITPLTGVSDYNQTFFTCIDRSGFAQDVTIADLQTYQSYKESVWSKEGGRINPHFVIFGQSDLVGKGTYYDTKGLAECCYLAVGLMFPQPLASASSFYFGLDIVAICTYRGVRFDDTNLNILTDVTGITQVGSNVTVSPSWYDSAKEFVLDAGKSVVAVFNTAKGLVVKVWNNLSDDAKSLIINPAAQLIGKFAVFAFNSVLASLFLKYGFSKNRIGFNVNDNNGDDNEPGEVLIPNSQYIEYPKWGEAIKNI